MELTWFDPAQLDGRPLAEAVALLEAARAADAPHEPSGTVANFCARVRHGWDGDPSLYALARESGRAVGVLEVGLPHWDNTHLGSVDVTIDPLDRRRGLGRWLFERGVERVRADGRSVLLSESSHAPVGVAFLTAMGFERASEEVERRQDVRAVDWPRLDREYTAAESRAKGYELLRMPEVIPDELLADVVALTRAINDAPTDALDVEDEVFSPERLRAFEAAQRAFDRRLYRLAARHCDSGELAGHTMVCVDVTRPWHGWQFDTSVLRPHRGHRLGLLLKIAMLRWLAEKEPQVRTLDTWNAASNTHMIRVNEVLGYRIVSRGVEWQRRLQRPLFRVDR